MAKLITNVGVFVGFLNPKHDGKLLLVRRTSPDSIIPGVSFKGNWELPGDAMEEVDTIAYNQSVIVAFQKAKEKTGIEIPIAEQPFLGHGATHFSRGRKATTSNKSYPAS